MAKEPRYVLCDGCGKPVVESKANERVESKGSGGPRVYCYCASCWRMRGG